MIKAGPAYDQRNEFENRDDVARELANKYDKRANIVVPFGQKLSFTSVSGKLATLGMDGSDNFTISIDGGAGVSFATQASVTTVDGKLTASYGFTVDVNGRIASMKLLSNGSTSSVKFTASTFQVYNGSTDEAPFEVVGGVVKIKTANIGDLNANNITAGTLNVDRINAGTIVTTKLATNAVTEGSIDEDDTSASVTTSWTALADVTLTIPDATTVVKLDWSVYIDTSGDPEDALEIRIKRGSTVIYETIAITVPPMISFFVEPDQQFDIPQRFNGQFGGFDSDTPGSAASFTYYLEGRSAYGSSAWGVSKRRFAAMQFKR